MEVPPAEAAAFANNARLKNAIRVAKVDGGSTTLPFWVSKIGDENFKTAVLRSLEAAGYAATKKDAAKYLLAAEITGVDQDLFGFDLDVVTTVTYTLTERSSKRVVFTENVTAKGTATMGESVWGTKRLRLANEHAAKKNISQLLKKLSALDTKSVALTFVPPP